MDFSRIEPVDDPVRELREVITMLENRHREDMRPYYEMLVRYEALRPQQPLILTLEQAALAGLLYK